MSLTGQSAEYCIMDDPIRQRPVVTWNTKNALHFETMLKLMKSGDPAWFKVPGKGEVHGYLIEVMPEGPGIKITVQPALSQNEAPPSCRYVNTLHIPKNTFKLGVQYAYDKETGIRMKLPYFGPHPPDTDSYITAEDCINYFKEKPGMKIVEGIVISVGKVDGTLQVTGIVKVVAPFLSESISAARDTVLFDYAKENNIAGKDLTGFQVRLREFPNNM